MLSALRSVQLVCSILFVVSLAAIIVGGFLGPNLTHAYYETELSRLYVDSTALVDCSTYSFVGTYATRCSESPYLRWKTKFAKDQYAICLEKAMNLEIVSSCHDGIPQKSFLYSVTNPNNYARGKKVLMQESGGVHLLSYAEPFDVDEGKWDQEGVARFLTKFYTMRSPNECSLACRHVLNQDVVVPNFVWATIGAIGSEPYYAFVLGLPLFHRVKQTLEQYAQSVAFLIMWSYVSSLPDFSVSLSKNLLNTTALTGQSVDLSFEAASSGIFLNPALIDELSDTGNTYSLITVDGIEKWLAWASEGMDDNSGPTGTEIRYADADRSEQLKAVARYVKEHIHNPSKALGPINSALVKEATGVPLSVGVEGYVSRQLQDSALSRVLGGGALCLLALESFSTIFPQVVYSFVGFAAGCSSDLSSVKSCKDSKLTSISPVLKKATRKKIPVNELTLSDDEVSALFLVTSESHLTKLELAVESYLASLAAGSSSCLLGSLKVDIDKCIVISQYMFHFGKASVVLMSLSPGTVLFGVPPAASLVLIKVKAAQVLGIGADGAIANWTDPIFKTQHSVNTAQTEYRDPNGAYTEQQLSRKFLAKGRGYTVMWKAAKYLCDWDLDCEFLDGVGSCAESDSCSPARVNGFGFSMPGNYYGAVELQEVEDAKAEREKYRRPKYFYLSLHLGDFWEQRLSYEKYPFDSGLSSVEYRKGAVVNQFFAGTLGLNVPKINNGFHEAGLSSVTFFRGYASLHVNRWSWESMQQRLENCDGEGPGSKGIDCDAPADMFAYGFKERTTHNDVPVNLYASFVHFTARQNLRPGYNETRSNYGKQMQKPYDASNRAGFIECASDHVCQTENRRFTYVCDTEYVFGEPFEFNFNLMLSSRLGNPRLMLHQKIRDSMAALTATSHPFRASDGEVLIMGRYRLIPASCGYLGCIGWFLGTFFALGAFLYLYASFTNPECFS